MPHISIMLLYVSLHYCRIIIEKKCTHVTSTDLHTLDYEYILSELNAWSHFCHDSWLLLDMKIQAKLQRVYFVCQPHPSTCSLTTPRPHPQLLHGKRHVPELSWAPLVVQGGILSHGLTLPEQYVCGVCGMLTFHRMASQYNLPNHTNQQIQHVWKP